MACIISNQESHTTGFLTKQGGSNKNWRKRYWVCEGYTLCYYKSQNQPTPLGIISLNGCTVEKAEDLGKDHCFQIYHPTRRTFFIFADTEENMLTWMDAIRRHIPSHDTSMKEHKVVMLGSGGVGKSALTIQLVHNQFMAEYEPTIEDSFLKQVTIDDVTSRLSILDTAGQEEYFTITDQYVEVGDGFMIVYDVTMPETFEEVLRIREKITIVKEDPDVPILLVANKVDLEDDRAVTTEAGEELAERFGTMYIETSAYTRQNVEEAFFSIVRGIRHRDEAFLLPTKKKKKDCVIS